VFFTPGWAAVLTLGGTLGGATLTQAVNSAISWRTTRKERKASITKAVSELIAGASAWVYATSSQEQDLFHAVATHVSEEKLMETLKSLRTDVYTAQLNRPGMSGDSTSWEGWSHVRWFVEEVSAGAA
jgi:hypothetical protein